MPMTNSPYPTMSVVGAALVAMAGLSLVAQTPSAPAAPTGSANQESTGVANAARGAAGRGAAGQRGAPSEPDFSPRPPVLPLSPAEEAKRFWLPPGFKIEPVLSEPDIEEPGQIAFDGNGRMFVIELRGYMQDIEATGELDPVGRISVHEDRNNDGVYETHRIFVDKLIFPRWVTPFGANSVLTMESNADDVWKFTDTDGDGIADKKEFFAAGFGRLTNVELQQSGLTWALDNWMYSTVNQHRVRWTPKGILKEPSSYNNGQWGITQDNYGKIYFQGGGSGLPTYFQLPAYYGYFNYADQFEPNLNITWGAPVFVADMVSGMNNVRMPDGSNIRTTAGAGNDIYRGDRLPKDMIGDYFYGETVARIVRRLRPVKTEGLTQLRNVYPLSEFIRSTDPLFRPVDMTTAPDGTMYITDMYRGIVQEREWNTPGSYLRQRIAQYQLDKVVRHGRIWRLSYEGMPRSTQQPRMLNETPAQLVAHLSHPNGWWRDTAQQLLVLKQDKSVVPALKRLVQPPSRPARGAVASASLAEAEGGGGTSTNQLGRIHALWTLEGLGAADAPLVRATMKDADPQIRIQAIRVSETLYKAGDRSFGDDYKAMTRDSDAEVVMQALMTHNILKVADTPTVARLTMDANKAKGVQLVASTILNPPLNVAGGRGGIRPDGLPAAFTTEEQAVMQKGEKIYTELCFACHGQDGRGEPVAGGVPGALRAPSLAASPRVIGHRDYVVKALLHGVTGPIDGERYNEVMSPMGSNPDEWIADVGSYVRNAFGNRTSFVTPADVARVRAATANRTTSWTVEESVAALPRLVIVEPNWKVTASHKMETASRALTFEPWTSGAPQEAGMWLQVELPRSVALTEIHFESAAPRTGARGTGAPGDPGSGTISVTYGGPPPAVESIGFPRAYQVTVSMDGITWSPPVAQGHGNGATTMISFAPVPAKFVRLTQTATVKNAPPLSILLLRLFEAPTP
jgi:mono/diheme cytochrome c family protein/glucose/arabinose dehydrogenase